MLVVGIAIPMTTLVVRAAPGAAEPTTPIVAAAAPDGTLLMAQPRLAVDTALLSDDVVTWSGARPAQRERPVMASATATASQDLDPELICMAKIVRHEAANQPRVGQLAVAQLIMNRVHSGKFPTTVCDVANQPGQFFNIAAYNPRRDNAQWETAVAVSREAFAGSAPDVTNGAYFYHAAMQAPNTFFRTRERVLALGDHIFYR